MILIRNCGCHRAPFFDVFIRLVMRSRRLSGRSNGWNERMRNLAPRGRQKEFWIRSIGQAAQFGGVVSRSTGLFGNKSERTVLWT